VIELVQLIQEVAGTDLQPEVLGTAQNEIQDQYLSSDKARRLLNWQPVFTLRSALAQTVEWYRAQLDAPL
jgi:nucleoside-diphosphate-sugar epimerase